MPTPSAAAVGPKSMTEVADVWLMSANGRDKVRLTDGHTANYAPVFAPDGRAFFTTNRSGHENIWSLYPAASTAISLRGGGFDQTTRKETIGPDGARQAQTVSVKGDSGL
jgi:Tol biopolymer transport system component